MFTLLLSAFSAATALGFAVLLIVDVAAGAPQAAIAKGLVLVAPTAAIALLLTRKEWSLGQLRVLEAAVFAAITLYLATGAYTLGVADLQAGGVGTGDWNATLLRFALLIVAYGVFVPNSVQRAAGVVVVIALTPIFVALLVRIRHPELQAAFNAAVSQRVFDSVLLLAVSAAVAIFAAMLIGRYFEAAYKFRRDTFYDLHELIGRGGMGEVWRASHRALARPAAVKLIREDKIEATDADSVRRVLLRFEREAKATATLRSPHTVQVYDAGITADGHFYYAMEYLEGLDLEALITRFGPVPPGRAIQFLAQACDSLGDAHANGMTHRDIKPANLHLSRRGPSGDFITLLDFGLVQTQVPLDDSGQLTVEGTTSGTPAYMAPEMAVQLDAVDGRADIYALGCVAYWLLTGKLVFEAETGVALIVEHVRTVPTPPSQRTELEIPPELEAIVMKCLEKDQADRFQTPGELAKALAAVPVSRPWNAKRAEEWWDLHLAEAHAA